VQWKNRESRPFFLNSTTLIPEQGERPDDYRKISESDIRSGVQQGALKNEQLFACMDCGSLGGPTA